MSDEIRIHYVSHFIKLSLWYINQLMQKEDIAFEAAIAHRVNVYRNTDFFDGKHQPAWGDEDADWDAYLVGLKAIFDRCEGEALEEEGLAYLWPRVTKTYHKPTVKNRPYECWTYECWTSDDGVDNVSLHIANVYQPKSPLSEMWSQFRGKLLELLIDVKKQNPDLKMVYCGSWMNSMAPFQTLFPKSWHDSASVSARSSWGMGHWGQFMDRTGRFHVRHGERLRATGEFPNPSLSCRAPLEEIVAHLENMAD